MRKIDEDLKEKFLAFIEPNKGIIGRLARVFCLNNEDFNDLFQDILFQLWKSYPMYRNECKPSTYIYTIAFNTACTRFKAEKRRHLTQAEYITNCVLEEKEEQYCLVNTNREKLYEAISRLSQINKLIISLYLDDYTHEEIAKFIGTTNINVRVKLHRIKVQLKKHFENENR